MDKAYAKEIKVFYDTTKPISTLAQKRAYKMTIARAHELYSAAIKKYMKSDSKSDLITIKYGSHTYDYYMVIGYCVIDARKLMF